MQTWGHGNPETANAITAAALLQLYSLKVPPQASTDSTDLSALYVQHTCLHLQTLTLR